MGGAEKGVKPPGQDSGPGMLGKGHSRAAHPFPACWPSREFALVGFRPLRCVTEPELLASRQDYIVESLILIFLSFPFFPFFLFFSSLSLFFFYTFMYLLCVCMCVAGTWSQRTSGDQFFPSM